MAKPLIVWIILFVLTVLSILLFSKKDIEKITGKNVKDKTNSYRLIIVTSFFLSTVLALIIKYIMKW